MGDTDTYVRKSPTPSANGQPIVSPRRSKQSIRGESLQVDPYKAGRQRQARLRKQEKEGNKRNQLREARKGQGDASDTESDSSDTDGEEETAPTSYRMQLEELQRAEGLDKQGKFAMAIEYYDKAMESVADAMKVSTDARTKRALTAQLTAIADRVATLQNRLATKQARKDGTETVSVEEAERREEAKRRARDRAKATRDQQSIDRREQQLLKDKENAYKAYLEKQALKLAAPVAARVEVVEEEEEFVDISDILREHAVKLHKDTMAGKMGGEPQPEWMSHKLKLLHRQYEDGSIIIDGDGQGEYWVVYKKKPRKPAMGCCGSRP